MSSLSEALEREARERETRWRLGDASLCMRCLADLPSDAPDPVLASCSCGTTGTLCEQCYGKVLDNTTGDVTGSARCWWCWACRAASTSSTSASPPSTARLERDATVVLVGLPKDGNMVIERARLARPSSHKPRT